MCHQIVLFFLILQDTSRNLILILNCLLSFLWCLLVGEVSCSRWILSFGACSPLFTLESNTLQKSEEIYVKSNQTFEFHLKLSVNLYKLCTLVDNKLDCVPRCPSYWSLLPEHCCTFDQQSIIHNIKNVYSKSMCISSWKLIAPNKIEFSTIKKVKIEFNLGWSRLIC